MNDAQKQDVMIFAEALDLPLSERAAHLDRACAGDQKLRQRVEGLLLTHDQAGGFLERPPVEAGWEPPLARSLVIESAATNCCSKLAKAAAAWFTWPNKRSRSIAESR